MHSGGKIWDWITTTKNVYKLIWIFKWNKYLTPSQTSQRSGAGLVVGQQVCTHLRRDFAPGGILQILPKSLKFRGWSLATRTFSSLHTFGDPRLARPLQDLYVLLLEPLLCWLGRVFWVIVMLEYPSTTHFQCPGPDGTRPRPSSLWCGAVVLSL